MSLPAFNGFLEQLFHSQAPEPEVQKTCALRLQPNAAVAAASVELSGISVIGQDSCNVAMVDITERIEAREEIERLNQALEIRVSQLGEVNDDLEASSAVAHDLQTPLTAMDSFKVMLEQALQTRDQALARHCTVRIGSLISQMTQTVEGLLALARVSTAPLRRADCDLTQMGADILQALREHSPTREVAFELEPGLLAQGDPALVRQLLANLLGNAWKFTAGFPLARIRLASERAQAHTLECRFVVEDNGAGFEMAHAERLFNPFERLHSVQEFPGSGIGLATVKRIVTRHGGQVSAYGAPGQGARFCFSLPTRPAPKPGLEKT